MWRDGERIDAVCAQAPRTTELVESLPLARIPGRAPAVFFSILKAGAHTDLNGTANMYGSNAMVTALIEVFSGSDESKALYPGDNSVFIDAVYANLFNRIPDPAGKAFWVNALNTNAMTITDTLRLLQQALPEAPQPLGDYVPALEAGNLLFVSGMLPVENGAAAFVGRVGEELTIESGRKAARLALVNALAVARDAVGLNRVAGVARLGVHVACSPTFNRMRP